MKSGIIDPNNLYKKHFECYLDKSLKLFLNSVFTYLFWTPGNIYFIPLYVDCNQQQQSIPESSAFLRIDLEVGT